MATCSHFEDFDDGATLLSKGMDPFLSSATNYAGGGPDGSYAMRAESGSGVRTTIDSCAESPRFTLIYDWDRTTTAVGSIHYHFTLDRIFASPPTPSWNGGNPNFFNLIIPTASPNNLRALWQTPPLGDNGGDDITYTDALPSVGSGWVTVKIDITFSTGFDPGGQPTDDAAFSFSWSPFVGAVAPDRDALTVRASETGVRIPNPFLMGEARSYDFFDWVPHGYIDNVCWDDHCSTVTTSGPQIDQSTPCPCPSGPGGGGALDTIPNPIGPLEPWTAMCDGGCGVDSVADVSVGEVWL